MKCRRLSMIALILAATAQPARADSIFVPGATAVQVVFDATVRFVGDDMPLSVGDQIAGTLTYDTQAMLPFNEFPLIDFTTEIAGMKFAMQDVLRSLIQELPGERPGTFRFDAQVILMGRPGLGALSDEFLLRVFQEEGVDSSVSVFGPASLVAADLTTIEFTPVPEPASLTLLGLGLAGISMRRWRGRS